MGFGYDWSFRRTLERFDFCLKDRRCSSSRAPTHHLAGNYPRRVTSRRRCQYLHDNKQARARRPLTGANGLNGDFHPTCIFLLHLRLIAQPDLTTGPTHACTLRRLVPLHVRTVTDLLVFLVILIIRLQLLHDPSIRVRANHDSQRWVGQYRQIVHCLGALDGVAGLCTMSFVHVFLGVDVVVGWVTVCERHGAAGPVGPACQR